MELKDATFYERLAGTRRAAEGKGAKAFCHDSQEEYSTGGLRL